MSSRPKGRPPIPAIERFWRRVDQNGPLCHLLGTQCWEWTGSRHHGYGQFFVGSWLTNDRRQCRAHRASYEFAHGPIPEGMFVCHRCDNPACVRPDHLFLGTAQDNTADMMTKGRDRYSVHGKPVQCKNGHSLIDNVYIFASGKRRCKTCDKAARTRWYARDGEAFQARRRIRRHAARA